MWDEESDLLYLRARYYEPETGRFLSRDTYEGEIENPLSKNLYSYVQNNPVNFTDPTGNMGWRQVDDLGYGVLSSIGDTIKSVVSPSTYLGLWDLGKAIVQKRISLQDIAKSAVKSAIGPVNYLYKNTYRVFAGNPSDHEVFTYGKNLGDFLQQVAGSGAAFKLVTKVAPRLIKFLKKLPSRFVKGTSKFINLNIRPVASNSKLQNIIKDLYKGQNGPNRIGNGTTMDAIRHELKTGKPVNGKFHSQKGKEYINALNKVLRSNISSNDKAIVKALLTDLQKALAGK